MEALIQSPHTMRVPYKRYFTTFYFRTPEARRMVDTIKVWFTGTPHVDFKPRKQVTLQYGIRFWHDGEGNCNAEAELPKLLHGHNGHLLTSQADIEASVTRLREVLFQVVKFESWKLKVVDLVWQFQTRPADVILAYQWIRFPGVRSWPSLELGDKQIHWTGARSRWELKFYDKAKGILRVELRLAGAQLRKRIDDDARLNFAELYQVFLADVRKLPTVQLPEARKHSLAEIVAGMPPEFQNQAVLAYQTNRTERAASGFKRDVSLARIKKVGWNLRELLPADKPPPPVHCEPRNLRRKCVDNTRRDNAPRVLCVLGILPIRDAWPHCIVILACLINLWILGGILWEKYSPNFHHKKGKSENGQNPGQQDNAAAGNVGKLGSDGIQSSTLGHDLGIGRSPAVCFFTFKKLFSQSFNFLAKLSFRIHQKLGTADTQKPPRSTNKNT